MDKNLVTFWSMPREKALSELRSRPEGLNADEARERLKRYGPNHLKPKKRVNAFTLLVSQFMSPIMLILLIATGLAFVLKDIPDAAIILAIVLISGLLGFWQERGANNAVKKLLSIVQIKTRVMRDCKDQEIPLEDVVPGDIILLGAGDVIPGDSLILESNDLFVNEATLTGETYPVEKESAVLQVDTALSKRTNSLFMGTNVVSGSSKAVVFYTGKSTEFGKVSQRLALKAPETEFERGVRRFGNLLLEVTLVLVIAIFAINVFLKKPVLDSFLFSLALAVGLTPQLLPAIISINLAHGAKRMAKSKVIVKRLESIENFGSMSVLCSDKTGTLTEGVIKLDGAYGVDGKVSEKLLYYAYFNAFYETGFSNPIDQAIREYKKFDVTGSTKLGEVPYDFTRKRLSIAVENGGKRLMITKGALSNVLACCISAEQRNGKIVDIAVIRKGIEKRFEDLSAQGYRILGLACKDIGKATTVSAGDEHGMTFLGFLSFFDPPKANVRETLKNLEALGVTFKIITGDNRSVAAYISRQVGCEDPLVISGPELGAMSDEALYAIAPDVDVFAEVEPNQKERIIMALRKTKNVVGYMGDGINDASALHAADVGLSVDSAVDVAKAAADIVLLEKNLEVLLEGVREGRKTFANTLKYVFMATSANFGNMFSMAGASLFLPFLPLLPKQILLTNLATDFPEMTIAADGVDKEMVSKPRRWNIKFIRNFMLTFGLVSSLFDYMTFGVLLLFLKATEAQFQTGWFLESVISASLVVLVVRTRRPFFKSMPGKYLLLSTFAIVAFTVVLPFTPLGTLFGFQPPQPIFLGAVGVIVALYIVTVEIAKRLFYRGMNTR